MELLIIGGTSFVGRAIAWSALRDHHVTVLNRGRTTTDLPDTVERLVGDRTGDLSAVAGRRFDATIDCVAYRPSDVDRLADAIGDRGGHHVHISSVSAYDHPPARATEASATIFADDLDLADRPVTGETYGPLKAMSERRATQRFTDVAVVRPTYVIGAHDATLRFPYWVARARRGGAVAVPGPSTNALQYIDARDLADFVVRLATSATTGAFNVAGPATPSGFLETIQRVIDHVAPPGTELVEVDPEVVERSGLQSSFPLWPGRSSQPGLDVESALAEANGLSLRPLEESVDDVVAWWGDRAWPSHWHTGENARRLLAERR